MVSLVDKAIQINSLIRAKYPGTTPINEEAFISIFTDYSRENAYLMNMLLNAYGFIDIRKWVSFEYGKLILCPFKAEKDIDRLLSHYQTCNEKP